MQIKINFLHSLVLKVRVFVTRKWLIGKREHPGNEVVAARRIFNSFVNMLNKCYV